MDPLLIAASAIGSLSALVTWFVLAVFSRRKRRQRELLADETRPDNRTPDGDRVFHSNWLAVSAYLLMLSIGTAMVLSAIFA